MLNVSNPETSVGGKRKAVDMVPGSFASKCKFVTDDSTSFVPSVPLLNCPSSSGEDRQRSNLQYSAVQSAPSGQHEREPEFEPHDSILQSSFAREPSFQALAEHTAPIATGEKFEARYALEIFGGKARFARALIDVAKLDATAVDWTRNKSKPCAPCLQLDLTQITGRNIVIRALKSGKVVYTHFAPPCGTSSRAREIPLSNEARARGVREPKPLRGPGWEDGFPDLVGEDALRVKLANTLYEFCSEAVLLIDAMGLLYSIENPDKSWFWLTSPMKALDKKLEKRGRPARRSRFQNCRLGGLRPKWSAFKHNLKSFDDLNEFICPGESAGHKHLPWGHDGTGFATSSEAEYPSELAIKLAELVAQELVTRKFVVVSTVKHAIQTDLGRISAEVGKQARGMRGPRLISEYMTTKRFCVNSIQGFVVGQNFDTDTTTLSGTIPAGSKVVRFCSTMDSNGVRRVGKILEESGDTIPLDDITLAVPSPVDDERSEVQVQVALPWTKEAFLDKAKELEHPVDCLSLHEQAYDNIVWTVTNSREQVISFRDGQIRKLERWAVEFSKAEMRLHDNLRPEFKPILANKKFLVFNKLLKEIGHSDTNVVHRMMSGFQLSGCLEQSGVFRKIEPKNAEPLEVNDLLKQCKWAQKAAEGGTKSCGDPELDRAVYSSTLEEVSRGALCGPFSSLEISTRLGPLWVPARRFGLRQGAKGKIREIDDFSIFGLNSTVVSDERISLGGTDEILALIKAMAESVDECGRVRLGKFKGSRHKDWEGDSVASLEGRCVDLKRAYKQLVRSAADRVFSIVAVYCPEQDCTMFFESIVLPFGSTGSVYGFNRVSFALRSALAKFLRLTVTSFYDDFPLIEFSALSWHTARVVDRFFEILGWEIAKDKEIPFKPKFRALGVQFDMEGIREGRGIVVDNTEERKDSISREITGILEQNSLSQAEAASLAGKLVYSESQHWGRIGSLVCRPLSERARSKSPWNKMDSELIEVLKFGRDLVLKSRPRTFVPQQDRRCNIIFTDACFEMGNNKGGVGGVIFPRDGSQPMFFGESIPQEIIDLWMSQGSKQIIGQAEMLPVIMAKRIWSKLLKGSRNIFFVDNESARECYVRHASPVVYSRALILSSVLEDSRLGALNWYARVPTLANWADEPSRGVFLDMMKIGALRCNVVWPSLDELRSASIARASKAWGEQAGAAAG